MEWIVDEKPQVLGSIADFGLGAPPAPLDINEKYVFAIRFNSPCSSLSEQLQQQRVKGFGFGDVDSYVPGSTVVKSGSRKRTGASQADLVPTWLKLFPAQPNSGTSCVIWFKGKWVGGRGFRGGATEGYGTDGIVETVWTKMGQLIYGTPPSSGGGGGAATSDDLTPVPGSQQLPGGSALFPPGPTTLPGGSPLFPSAPAPTINVRVVVGARQDAAPTEVIFDGPMPTAQAQTAAQNLQNQPSGRWAVLLTYGNQTVNVKVSDAAIANIRQLFGAPAATPVTSPLADATQRISDAQQRCPSKANELFALRAQYQATMAASSVQDADAELTQAIEALCPTAGGGGGGGGGGPSGGGPSGGGVQVPPALEDIFRDATQRCPQEKGRIDKVRDYYRTLAQSDPAAAFDSAAKSIAQICPSGAQQAEADLGFPIPDMAGIPTGTALAAIEAVSKAVAECPGLGGPNGAAAHALGAFAVFGVAAATAGLPVQPHLDALLDTLTKLCPTWKGGQPGVPNPSPPAPPTDRQSVSDLLASLVLFLGNQDFDQLADVAAQAAVAGLPRLADAIRQYLESGAAAPPGGDTTTPGGGDTTTPGGGGPGPGPGPGPDTVTTTTTKKKDNTGLIVGIGIAVGVGVLIWKFGG